MTNNNLAVAPTSAYRTLMLDLIFAESDEDIVLSATNLVSHLDVKGLNDTWLDPRFDIDSSDGYAMMLKFRDGEELMMRVQHGWEVTSYLIENEWHFVQKSGNNWYLTEAASDEMIMA